MICLICSALDAPDDRDYIIQLYQEYHPLMFATARRYAADLADCEDIVQESIIRLIHKIDDLRALERCVLPSYIVSTVRNTAINDLKRQAVAKKHSSPLAEEPEAPGSDPEALVQLLDHRTQLAGLWKRISEEERFLLEGKYILGYSNPELAEWLGCKPDSVRMKLTRARRKALEILKQQEEGEINEQKGTTSGKI